MKIKPPFIACLLLFVTVGLIALFHGSPWSSDRRGPAAATASRAGNGSTTPLSVEPSNPGRGTARKQQVRAERGSGSEIFSYAGKVELPPVSLNPAVVKSVLSRKAIQLDVARLDAIRDQGHGMIQIDAGEAGWISASIDRVLPNWGGGYSLSGSLPGSSHGTFMATVNRGSVVAEIRGSSAGGGEFTICSNSAGIQEFREVDRAALPGCGGEKKAHKHAADALESAADQYGQVKRVSPAPSSPPAAANDDGSVIDVMVVYTTAAKTSAGGDSAMIALINQGINETNGAFSASNVKTSFRLAHAMETDYTETTDIEQDLSRFTEKSDGHMDDVHVERDKYYADICSLWTAGGYPDAAGVGYLMTDLSQDFEELAFNVCSVDAAVSNFTFAHECGHNMGCNHDRDNGSPNALYPYSYGHRWIGSSGTEYRSIMAYAPGIRVPNYSNPDVQYEGVATGTDKANNALSINNARDTVSNWRDSSNRVSINTLTIQSPNGGEKFFRGAPMEITWLSDVTGQIAIDLMEGNEVLSVITPGTENMNRYTWNIPANLALGSNYFIRVRTLTNEVDVIDRSDAPFSVVQGNFPANNQVPLGWVKPPKAAGGWVPSKKFSIEGGYSLASEPIGDAKRAAISYTSVFLPGTISFYVKVSSELNCDFFRFYVDGVEVDLKGSVEGLSGSVNWKYVSYPLKAGKHTLMWEYIKDDSYGDAMDRAWIDGVILPDEAQEIAVTKSGTNIANKSTSDFPKTKLTQKTAAKTFVVKNVGTAVLKNLSADIVGKNPGDFTATELGVTKLAPGATAEIKVRFAPTAAGARKAILRITSNDTNENPFDIRLTGEGQGLPRLRLYQPQSNELADAKDSIPFGSAKVGQVGAVKTFTVANTGRYMLKNLRVELGAKGNTSSFTVGPIGVNRLAPGELTTFKVYFTPKKTGPLEATLQVLSNDLRRTPFDVKLTGKGSAAKSTSADLASAPLAKSSTPGTVAATTSTVTVGDARYLTLSLEKSADPLDGHVIEVSPDLIHWYSGTKYTTKLRDDETILKARDNTPIEPGVKRYIRGRVLDN